MMVLSKPKHVAEFVIYFIVNFNVLKQINCALVGVTKDWKNSHASPLRLFQYILLHLFPSTNFASEHLFLPRELQTPIRPTHPAEL